MHRCEYFQRVALSDIRHRDCTVVVGVSYETRARRSNSLINSSMKLVVWTRCPLVNGLKLFRLRLEFNVRHAAAPRRHIWWVSQNLSVLFELKWKKKSVAQHEPQTTNLPYRPNKTSKSCVHQLRFGISSTKVNGTVSFWRVRDCCSFEPRVMLMTTSP